MPIDRLLAPRAKDLGGGFTVRRLLPAAQQPMVGPFIFFDHFGPLTAHPGGNHDVRPHPHIGLATVTYLFEGAMLHRDSLGSVQRIEPGAVNWMTAGRGIVHSERTPPDLKGVAHTTHGLQLWVALPRAHEDTAPTFCHTGKDAIPVWAQEGVTVRVLAGEFAGLESPVATLASTLYLDVAAAAGSRIVIPDAMQGMAIERAVYSTDAPVWIDGVELPPFTMAVIAPGAAARLEARADARCVVIGGAPFGEHRFIGWNFVASSKERIEAAKADWQAQRFGAVPGETEWIPLP